MMEFAPNVMDFVLVETMDFVLKMMDLVAAGRQGLHQVESDARADVDARKGVQSAEQAGHDNPQQPEERPEQ